MSKVGTNPCDDESDDDGTPTPVLDWWRRSTLNGVAIAILLAFIAIWLAIIIRGWKEFAELNLDDPAGPIVLSEGLTAAAGAITTLLAARTAAVLGFTIASVSGDDTQQLTPSTVNANLNWATRWAIYTYLIVGLFLIADWVIMNVYAPQVVAAYALGALGWLGGAAGVTFKAPSKPTTTTEDEV